MKKITSCVLLSLWLITTVWAQSANFTIRDIRVEGLQRISAGTVFTYLPVKIGGSIGREDFPRIIRELFKTGFFTDVSLARDGDVLVIDVVERPSIAEIEISGNKDISEAELKASLKEVGMAEGRVFDRALLEKVEQELLRQYFGRGKYGVRVSSDVRELPRNRVAISLDVSEGVAARIRQINIVGNEDFDDDDLLDEFQLQTPGLITILSKDDQYSKQKLTADIEALRTFYLDRGYLQFKVESTQVSISPDKKDIYLTVNITEGEPYTISSISLSGDLILPEAELRELITVQASEVFSRSKVNDDLERIGNKLGDEGYAFSDINAAPAIDETTKQVALDFVIDPGKRVYVRRINFTGNLKTNDEVLRREMRQAEGGWFSTKDINRSRTRLRRLDYLSDVKLDTLPVPGTSDQVDINIEVGEQLSSSVTFGVGYGQTEGVLLNAGLELKNFLGTGNEVGFNFNNSDADTLYSLSYNNPYYTSDGVSRGFRISYQETDASQNNTADYLLDRFLGQLQYGFPLNEFDSIRFGIGAEQLKIKTTDQSPPEIIDFLAQNGDTYLNFKLDGGWSRDNRNRAFFPTEGALNRISLEATAPSSDAEYYKIDYNHRSYYPLAKSLTFLARTSLGYGDGFGDFDELPFWESYFVGGLRSVRGYQANTLGPRFSNDEPRGGSVRISGGAELITPVPLLKDSKNFRIAAFVDVGSVFAAPSDFEADQLRYSAGVMFMWLSPLGPLAMSLAEPLNADDSDNIERFQFSFGIPF